MSYRIITLHHIVLHRIASHVITDVVCVASRQGSVWPVSPWHASIAARDIALDSPVFSLTTSGGGDERDDAEHDDAEHDEGERQRQVGVRVSVRAGVRVAVGSRIGVRVREPRGVQG